MMCAACNRELSELEEAVNPESTVCSVGYGCDVFDNGDVEGFWNNDYDVYDNNDEE